MPQTGELAPETILRNAAIALEVLREAVGIPVDDLAFRAEMTPEHLWAIFNGAPITPAEAGRVGLELSLILMTTEEVAPNA